MLSLRIMTLVTLTLGSLLAGCATTPAVRSSGYRPGRLLTAEEIQQNGGRTAWEVLQRSGIPLNFDEDQVEGPSQISLRRRGTSRSGALLIVDGAATRDLAILRELHAETIQSIRVIHRFEGSPMMGQAGILDPEVVIEVITKGPRR
jgi:hypothetical protein